MFKIIMMHIWPWGRLRNLQNAINHQADLIEVLNNENSVIRNRLDGFLNRDEHGRFIGRKKFNG